MKLFYPTARKPFPITQKYDENANSYYKEGGLTAHGAVDVYCEFNETIYCAVAGEVFSVRNKDNPDLMRYRAVYSLVEDDTGIYEVSYGHANSIYVKVGDLVEVGDSLMSAGNTGDVASGGKKVTKEMKDAGSKAGTHLHLQIRKLKKVQIRSLGKQYLMNDFGYFKKDGYFFEVLDYNNGFKGCIDPMPFFNGLYAHEQSVNTNEELLKLVDNPREFSHTWHKNLKLGDYSDDVKYMQIAYMILGFLNRIPEKELGYFGVKTMKANESFQKSQGISPAPANFGPKSRASLNRIFMVK